MKRSFLALVVAAALPLVACGASDESGTSPAATNHVPEVTKAVKVYIQANLDDLVAATQALRDATPSPDADGWNAKDDAAAVANMRAAWRKARVAYERIEGAIAVLFPEIDLYTDERYDGFLGEAADPYLFDGEGVTGIHAVERILYADQIPKVVIDFESKLAGYVPAAFPANAKEATDFRDGLVARLVKEVTEMRDQFAPLELDLAAALYGVRGSMREQVEKMNRASLGAEESRYAQFTLADMKANVEGGRAIYLAFQPWLRDSAEGAALDARVTAGFARVDAAYAVLPGDALPEKPTTWSSMPSSADLATPFGKLYTVVATEGDITNDASLATDMTAAGAFLKLTAPED